MVVSTIKPLSWRRKRDASSDHAHAVASDHHLVGRSESHTKTVPHAGMAWVPPKCGEVSLGNP
jgi:hypothetical protein